MDKLDVMGYWWLPLLEAERLPGRLVFDQNRGANLQLVGTFPDPNSVVGFNTTHYEKYIHGVTTRGDRVTLYDCKGGKLPRAFSDACETEWDAKFIFLGGWYSDDLPPSFVRVNLEMTGLREWAYSHPFRPPSGADTPPQNDLPTVTYYPSRDVDIKLPGAVVSINHRCHCAYSLFRSSLEYDVFLSFSLDVSEGVEEFLRSQLRPFQDFLSFVTGKAIVVRGVRGYASDDSEIKVYYEQNIQQEADSEVEIQYCLFSMASLESEVQEVIVKWYHLWKKSDPVIGLLLSSRYRAVYLEHRFLTAIQCIETYHRVNRENKKQVPQDLLAFKNGLIEGCPDRYKDWLRANLERPNEPSLRERLTELAGEAELVLKPIIPSVEDMVGAITFNRNYYTHYDQRKRGKALRGSKLFRLTQAANFMLMFCILRDLGFEAERCSQFLRRDPAYQYLKYLAKAGELS